MSTSVVISTLTTRMKIMASANVGTAWPTLSVPGMFSSATTPPSLNIDVVVANEPTPSVSRKSVTKPMPSWSGVGHTGAPGGRARRASRTQTAMNTTPTTASEANRTPLAEISISWGDSRTHLTECADSWRRLDGARTSRHGRFVKLADLLRRNRADAGLSEVEPAGEDAAGRGLVPPAGAVEPQPQG